MRPTMSKLNRLALAAVAVPLLLAAAPADAAAPTRGKTRKTEAKVIKLDKKYITKPARAVTGGKVSPTPPAPGVGGVLPAQPGEWAFALSANTPNIPGGGYLVAHYARDWEPDGQAGPGGKIWLSQNRLPNETYVKAQLFVKPTHEYEVTVCTEGSELVRAKVGNTSHAFPAGNSDCDLTIVLKPTEEGIASIMLEFINPPGENQANSFAVRRIEVIRR